MGLMCSECVERKRPPKDLYRIDSTINPKQEIQDFITNIKESSGREALEL